jgi:hypothetical protein
MGLVTLLFTHSYHDYIVAQIIFHSISPATMSHHIQPKKCSVKAIPLDDEVSTSRQRNKKAMELDTMDMIEEDDLDDTRGDNDGQDKTDNDGDENEVSQHGTT